jgi:hypothetical protein
LRRSLILILLGLALFAAAAWSGFYVVGRIAPERLRIATERRLSDLLDAPVRIERTGLSLRWGLILEARGVEVESAGAKRRLRIERASARLDPVALLMARFQLDRLTLEGASFSIERSARGPESERDLRDAIQALDQAARFLLGEALPIRTVELRGGTVLLTDRAAPEPVAIRIGAMSGRAQRASFRRRTDLRVRGEIRDSKGEGGSVELRAEATRTVLRATLTLQPVELAILEPYASLFGVATSLAGVAGGSVDWQYRPGRPQSFTIRLEGSGLQASLLRGGEKSPFEIAVTRPTLAARIEASPDALRLREGEISDGRMTLRADGSLALPVTKSASLRLAVHLDELPLVRIRDELPAYLPPELRARLDPLSQRLEGGRLLEFHAEARTTVAGFRELLETRLLGRPGEITLRAEIADAELRVGRNETRLEALGGSAIWTGHDLELRGVRGRLGTRSLPKIDATVRGLAQIRSPDEVNCIRPPAEVSLPGWKGLRDWLRPSDRPSGKPSWKRLTVDADWILHPALLCSLERAFGELTPVQDGLDFAVQHGVWAGIPIRGTGSYRRAPEESLRVELSLGPPFEPMRLDPAADPWARGHFEYQATRLGQWKIRGFSGGFRTSGSTLRLEKSALHLDPVGAVEGNLEIALGSEVELPYRIEFQVRKMDLVDLSVSSGREKEALSGRLLGAGVVTGHLQQGLSLFTDAEGMVSLHAREGKIHQELPPFVAIAVASDRFDPFRSRDELPYTTIDLVGRIEKGVLHSEFLALDAPSVAMVASGQIGLAPPHDLEAVMGMFLFRTLDSLIDRVPVLNRVILGRDKNLVGAYFAMTGTWKTPKAQLVPIKSFAEGPAHFMLEGPGFLWSGLKRLDSLLSPSSPAPSADDEEAGPES